MDPRFKVEVISKMPNPQQVMWAAAHQDYSEGFVFDEFEQWPDEAKAGESLVKMLLKGDKGHYGPLEHPQIVLNCGYFPHSVMQQARTHRVGISFDVQSMRYTGSRIADLGEKILEGHHDTGANLDLLISNCDDLIEGIEDAFYVRPVGEYTDRQGKRYEVTAKQRINKIIRCGKAAVLYLEDLAENGYSEEHARGSLPFDYRQHFVVSLNVRSFMHFLDLRSKKDAQGEIQAMCDLMWPHFKKWVPAIADWYESNRYGKARLAP